MISQLMRKWFGLPEPTCATCEILRDQLDKSEGERKELLSRLLQRDRPEPLPTPVEEFKPVTPNFVPWRVKQQMLEAEDRQRAKLMQDRAKEIADLEKELGVSDASQVS